MVAYAYSYEAFVKDTSSTGGTGNLTLSGSATAPYRTFNAAFGTGVYFPYAIKNSSDWEEGWGHLSASTTFVRDIVTDSSNAGAAVNWPASAIDIYCAAPTAAQLQDIPTIGQALAVSYGMAMP